ncbi:helix-turn-helix domain-containing protein [Membranihabitans marinus]|uniref:helix-turn-helix domain-containing protein n=1 Tax=Membranihabitans marinus TaxID=1227546 RepID=UPI001F3CC0B8|nr:AraC family transcriptional regulator [Membranihabitans marinus]
MGKSYFIKNMVCNRCLAIVANEFDRAGFQIEKIELGRVKVIQDLPKSFEALEQRLIQHGFEVINDENQQTLEQIKIELLKKVEGQQDDNISETLSKTFQKSYSVLSKMFSKSEGKTIEKYLIELRIEKAKEMIQLGELNFSEIAYALNYNSSSHLSSQFKSITGLSMSDYKNQQQWDRKTLDQIV